jgi:hypothetical protein
LIVLANVRIRYLAVTSLSIPHFTLLEYPRSPRERVRMRV